MSDSTAHFSVDTRLARLLGEGYRSSEAALKELVDNAWDADAEHVWITLPAPMTSDPIIVRDDGSGMTGAQMQSEYLNIASDKRRRSGDRTAKLNRRVKGKNGIGKFAGLMIAKSMQVTSYARGRSCSLLIDKQALLDRQDDLESVDLPFRERVENGNGTIVVLSNLDVNLNFPTPERLREILVLEYGRENSFKVHVNNNILSVDDVPGPTKTITKTDPIAGEISLRFTISDGSKSPRSPGIALKFNGKTIGKPMFFGLEDDEEVPASLRKRLYGEVDISGLNEEHISADWSGIIENSKPFQAAHKHIMDTLKYELEITYKKEINLQRARLQRQIDIRLQKLPEHRRRYAQEALNRILKKFYGETEDRIATIADVALDAMEHDAYWAVLEQIGASSKGDMDAFATSLQQFGLLELSTIGVQAKSRQCFLDYFDQLVENPKTVEKDTHKALETNLWMLGRNYSTMASNATLRHIISIYCDEKYKGKRADKRPDLLLSQDYNDTYLLIEFKRPSHPISRDDIAQAEKYRDDLNQRLSSTAKMEIMMVGKGRAATVDSRNMANYISIHSYSSLISAARSELEWLIRSLG